MADVSIQREVVIDAPVDVVWRTITEPDEITKWFADRVEVDVRPQATGSLVFDNKETSRTTTAAVVIDTVDPPHRFSFRWGHSEGDVPGPHNSVLVQFTLTVEGDARTRLRVVESGLDEVRWPDDEKREYVTGHGSGWDQCLERLGRAVHPGGIVTGHSTGDSTGEAGDDLLSAIADPSRRRVLDLLVREGEATASSLADEVPFTRQAVIKHLVVLEDAGLVSRRREGREVRFQVDSERIDEATRAMVRLAKEWDQRLAAIKRIAEAAHRQAQREQGD